MCRVCLVYSFTPAIHLLRLKVASIFEQLDVVEQEANHSFCFFQVRLHLRCVLSRFPRAHHPHVLQRADTEFTALHVAAASSDQTPSVKGLCLTVCSRVSTWLSCSSHTPDSVWTLLTTLWSRSNLRRKRWRSKVNKHFRQRRLPDFLPVELASIFTSSDVIISSGNLQN